MFVCFLVATGATIGEIPPYYISRVGQQDY